MNKSDGISHQVFNNLLEQQLKQLVFEIDKNDTKKMRQLLKVKLFTTEKVMLFIPAVAGFIIHSALYLPVKSFTWSRTKNNDHYDSVLTALLLFTYPVYLMLIMIFAFQITKNWLCLILLILIPFTAWSYIKLKPQLDKR